MVGQTEQITGNLLFYGYILSKRNPAFLNRNLVRALEQHKRELHSPSVQPSASSLKRARWRYPSDAALQKMLEDEDANKAFVVELKSIEPLGSKKRSSGRPARNIRLLFRIDVDIQITIVNRAVICKRLEPRKVTMIGSQSEHGKHASLAFSPVKIKLSELLRVPESSWRKTRPQDWDLLVTLNFQDTRDAQEFYKHMIAPTSHLHRDPATRLLMNWINIRECPGDDKVLPLSTKSSAGNADQLDIGILARLYWTSTIAGSILEAYNQQNNGLSGDQYLTPLPTPRTVSGKEYQLTFVIADKKRVQRDLSCPHDPCPRRFSQVDDLHMHLESWHDKFKYTFVNERQANGVEHWIVNCEVAEHRPKQARASNATPDPREIRQRAPREPFNQQKYLQEGNEDFQRAARGDKLARPLLRGSTKTQMTAKPSRHPDEVRERERAKRRTYRVPKAPPGVSFFRSISKRPLHEGEYISESDDDVDMDWLQAKQDAQLDRDPSMSEANKRFIKIFDPFIRAERIPDDIYVGDAMVRFARAHAASLWDENVVDEFRIKITELLEDSIISKDIHAGCLAIVHDHDPAKNSEKRATSSGAPLSAALNVLKDSPRTRSKGKGKAIVTETGQITPQTADSEGDIEMQDVTPVSQPECPDMSKVDQCLCGEDAAFSSRRRLYIVCESVICVRRAFHLDCVMKYWKPPQSPDPNATDWTCNDCQRFA